MFERFDDLDDRPGRNPAGDADDQGVEVAFGEFFDRTLCLFPFGIIADRRCFDQLHAAFFELIRGEATSLGAAILGAVACGDFADTAAAAARMVRISARIEPDGDSAAYQEYFRQYQKLNSLLMPTFGGRL